MTISESKRVAIENVYPSIDNGRFPIKRIIGEKVKVKADIFADGHDEISAFLLYRNAKKKKWKNIPMILIDNDKWESEFVVEELGSYIYTVWAWIDVFSTWQKDTKKKIDAGQDVSVEVMAGILLMQDAASRAGAVDKKKIMDYAAKVKKEKKSAVAAGMLFESAITGIVSSYPYINDSTLYDKVLEVSVDIKKAGFSTWYEVFPRSCGTDPARQGTLKDCVKILPDIADMNFDVLYLPPIHPIGETNRKSVNNEKTSKDGEPGCPWAIGSKKGGHKSLDPLLGTMNDFNKLVTTASSMGISVALDVAFQCSPDHPYIKEHPEWFKKRPDGSIQHAENPPKKYEDVVPLNFQIENYRELWEELKSIFIFWLEKGVKIFRVDNPHTKPFAFWDWVIAEVKKEYPETIFLAEAFTRPKIMYRLAKAGFTQSYTYFTWRNTKEEFTEYLTELTTESCRDFFKPNFWTNTPDILPPHLQTGGRAMFIARYILAATMSSNCGIYGPVFELCIGDALPGREEYSNSEKYEIKHWDRNAPGNIKDIISKVNLIRKENRALQTTNNIVFCSIENENLIAYLKISEDKSNVILVVVNLDPHNKQIGWVDIELMEAGLEPDSEYVVRDLLNEAEYSWRSEKNYIELDPKVRQAHIFKILK